MPAKFSVALSNTYTDYRSTSTTNSAIGFGLFEFLGATPAYMSELYTIYKYAKISAVEVSCDIVNLGSFPITLAFATLPYADYTGTTGPLDLIERPRSVYTTIGGNSGVNKGKLYCKYDSVRELGQLTFDKAHWVTSAQAAATAPVDVDAPLVVCSVGASSGGADTCSFLLTYRVTYHATFFSLESTI